MRIAIAIFVAALAAIAGCTPISDEPQAHAAEAVKPPAAPAKPDPARAFNAYHAGRITARLLNEKAKGMNPQAADLALLRSAYASLKIDPVFLDLPADGKYEEMAEAIVIDAGKKIGSLEPHGGALRAGFGAGMQVFIVERLLRLDIGAVTEESRGQIVDLLRGPLLSNAMAAGYSPKLIAAFEEADQMLAQEPRVPVVTRKKWDALMADLDDFERAKSLLVGDSNGDGPIKGAPAGKGGS